MGNETEKGTTLIVVLIALGFISFLSLILVEYGLWHSRLDSVNRDIVYLQQAHRLAESRTASYLSQTLPDSSVINQGKTLEWTLPPDDIQVEATIRSLNAKISLNRFREANATESFRDLVEGLLDELNYPDRTMQELARWIVSEKQQSGLGSSPYGGYGYSAPHRKILHLDEITLISGFKEIGLKEEFRRLFTVYGEGTLNPLHLTPDQWELLKNVLGKRLPNLPQSALRNQRTLREYLEQDDVWGELSETFPFFTKKDDSFRVDYRLKQGNTLLGRRTIMTFDYEEEVITPESRYPVAIEDFDQEDED